MAALKSSDEIPTRRGLKPLASMIFLSRWLQAPLYLGLIVAQGVYVYRFMLELWELFATAGIIHSKHAAETIQTNFVQQITQTGTNYLAVAVAPVIPEVNHQAKIMLAVLGLIDVVMIANLLIMVIVGGYETFVSKLNLAGHPDQPEWLSHVNAGVLKVKLATALVGISSIHLLKTFIEIPHTLGGAHGQQVVLWQVVIHLAFIVSALLLAWTDRIIAKPAHGH